MVEATVVVVVVVVVIVVIIVVVVLLVITDHIKFSFKEQGSRQINQRTL